MRFSSMPTGAKVGAGVAGLGATGLLLYRVLPPQMLYYVMIGTLLLGVLMGVLHWLVGKVRKRKAKPMEKSLKDNSAATPQGVAEPARRARLDDLRKNFSDGVEKFKAAGKNLYSLPWYVLVGESGSGKTEAIRHWNIPFPPGLQDQLQGVGGTINMNWWFTNDAIILDTAGRMMFEEVEAGASSEWREFLKLLRANRPSCPINGMLLCIPTDSLIKDTADQLERKGAKIAQQLDQIQRALGVRFPVFVMVTKCDLINGFREFFEDITDPVLQHQMMGWSNPAALDEPFNPELVSDHLQTVVQRLIRRRLGLLLDPINTEDSSARRTDQVDAMYAFPQALMAIAPRLRRYLEMIFVAGEWSAKPLFLRGIYFTSSMREGSALDAELAEALGVPVESLPEGRVWERDRAYFLRDLFKHKVFREKGLVTNATNAKGRQRRRKAVVLAAGFLSVILLALFTWWGFAGFRDSIGAEAEYWLAAARQEHWDDSNQWIPIVDPEFKGSANYSYGGMNEIETPSGKLPVGRFHHDTMKLVQKPIKVPWVFKFAATFSGSINEARKGAQRVLYEAGVLRPLVHGVRTKMLRPGQWSTKATAALAQLIRLENHSVYPPEAERMALGRLFDYVLQNKEDYEVYSAKDAKNLDEIIAWTYAEDGEIWPPKSLAPASEFAVATIDKGVSDFINYWQAGGGIESGDILEAIAVLKTALGNFRKAEDDLLQVDDPYVEKPREPETLQALRTVEGRWRTRYAAAVAESKKIEGAVLAAKLGVKTLVEMYDETIQEQLKGARDPHMILISAARSRKKRVAEEEVTESQETKLRKKHLENVATRVEASLAGLEEKLKETKLRDELLVLDPRYLQYVPVRDKELRRRLETDTLRMYAVRMNMYQTADLHVEKKESGTAMAGLATAIDAVREDTKARSLHIDDLYALRLEKGYLFKEAAEVSKFASERLAQRRRIYTLIKHVLDNAPKTASDVAAKVTEAVKARPWQPIRRPYMPGTAFKKDQTFPPEYHPDAAAATFAGWKKIADVVKLPSPETAKEDVYVINRQELAALYQARQDAYNAYLAKYQDYWIKEVLAGLTYTSPDWKTFQKDLIGMQVRNVMMDLDRLGKTILDSLDRVKAVVPAGAMAKYNEVVRRLAEDRGKFETGAYIGIWQSWLRRWKDLGDDPDAARKTILPKTPSQFIDDYMPFSAGVDTLISEKYWKELAYAGLRLLAKEIDVRVQQSYTDLHRMYSRFPITKPKPGTKELTAEEALAARAAVLRVLGAATIYNKKTIGGGSRTRQFIEIDKQLDRLCGLGLAPENRLWCEKAKAVLDGLPPKGEAYSCTVSILGKEDQAQTLSVLGIWAVLQIDQGDTKAGIRNVTQPSVKDVGKIGYPGKDVVFKFYRFPVAVQQGNVDRTKSIPGTWASVGVIHVLNSKRVSQDGTKWHAEIVIQDSEGRNRSLWIELEFARPLPKLADWPEAG
jgi:hypothetical protein